MIPLTPGPSIQRWHRSIADYCGAFYLPPLAGHDEIGVPSTALGTSQQPRPIDNRHPRAVLGNQRGDVGLGSVIAALTPYDPHMGRDSLAQGHRRRLAFIAA